MISQADLQVISTVFGKSTDDLSGALSSQEEVSLGLRLNGRVISQEDERNLTESKIKQGKEIGYKEIAKSLELELDPGEKDPSLIAEKLKNTLSASFEEKYKNMTPSDEINQWKSKADEGEQKYIKLKQTYEQTFSEIEDWQKKYSTLESEIKTKEINNSILGNLPDKLKIDKSDALLIFRNTYQIEDTEKGRVFKKDGNIITDAVGNPESLDNVLKSFVEEKKLIRGAGMGGDDNKGGFNLKGMSPEQAHRYLKDKGVEPASPEGLRIFREIITK